MTLILFDYFDDSFTIIYHVVNLPSTVFCLIFNRQAACEFEDLLVLAQPPFSLGVGDTMKQKLHCGTVWQSASNVLPSTFYPLH